MIGSCPECQESIRIPQGNEADTVRCPLCSAEYPLREVLESLPPELEIVSKAGAGLAIEVDSSDESELKLAKAESIESGPTPSRRYQPKKRKQVNMFAEILKVILGGVVAIPVGVLCVWWFAGRAPFGVAETVSKYVPWIVPEKLRGGDRIDDLDSERDEVNPNDGNPNDEKPGNRVPSKRRPPDRDLNKSPQQGGNIGFKKSIADQFPNGGMFGGGSSKPPNKKRAREKKSNADDLSQSSNDAKTSKPKKTNAEEKTGKPGIPKQSAPQKDKASVKQDSNSVNQKNSAVPSEDKTERTPNK